MITKNLKDKVSAWLLTLVSGVLVFFITLVFDLKDEQIKTRVELDQVRAEQKDMWQKYNKAQDNAREELKYIYEQLNKK